jgi:prolyl-tRNA editing enzyme YbaK/EbsC (Cys-tRNA(Pro) deacylase)
MPKNDHVSETPATQFLKAHQVAFTERQPEVASKHSGYHVGGTSPFETRRAMPTYIEETILALPKIAINGGRRGYLVGIDPQVCLTLLNAKPVHCALAE